jgi:exonuclease SbcD
LGSIDRTPEQLRAVDRILGYCDEHRVEVLVVAGDIFENYRGEALSNLVTELANRLRPQLERGRHAMFIPGNHDREHLFRVLETVQGLSADAAKRLIFVSRPQIVAIEHPDGRVQFILAPYPTAHRYLPPDAGIQGLGMAERHEVLGRAFARTLDGLRGQVDPAEAAVLISHIYVRTAERSKPFRMSESEEIPINPQDLPDWSYVALGHIHKPQAVGGRAHVRYSGSAERLDAGEAFDEKSCVLIETVGAGLADEPTLLPLEATPIYGVPVASGEDMQALVTRYPDHDRALVHLRISYRPGQDNPTAILEELRRIFPRAYERTITPVTEAVGPDQHVDRRNLLATVEAYLQQQLETNPRRDHLLDIARDLVEEVRRASAEA